MIHRLITRMPGYQQLHQLMDTGSSRQTTARDLCEKMYASRGGHLSILDVGCGEGSSLKWLQQLDPQVIWFGVDIEDSPEVRARKESDARMVAFDGINLPFADNSFDILYCHQVLEHVRRPYELVREIARVMRPGGLFIGSVAYLEPYHSFSVFNITPYGLTVILSSADLLPMQLKHSSDAFYKIFRQMLGGCSFFGRLSRLSVVYLLISILGSIFRSDRRDVNLLKIQYSGSYCFVAGKASNS